MSKFKTTVSASLRWSWFALLVILAFGYLAAGLSTPPQSNLEQPGDQLAGGMGADAGPADGRINLSADNASITETIAAIDQRWSEAIHSAGLEPAERADWLTVCRRISLALVGNGLSLEEIRELEQLPESVRVAAHQKNLLGDPRFHHYWGERWTRFLVGTDGGQFIAYRRRRFRVWLEEVFTANLPYDQMVRKLITAQGLWTDKPEVNFLTATFDSNEGSPDPIRLAARTSRAFLGLRIDCLQCHNDFLGNVNLGDVNEPREGMQTDFHQLAAFYTSAKSSGLQGVKSGEVEYNYKYLDATAEVPVQPGVPYSPELLPSEGEPRERLAAWVTHPQNRQAARAAVSHVWALMFGQPVGEAVDNLPLDEDTNPIVELLADDFVDNGFDMRRLIRLISGSSAFRVDSRADFDVTEKHEQTLAVFPLVRLRPEQVASSIVQAARIKKTDRESSLFLQLQTLAGTNGFVTQYGDMGEDEFTTDSVTITQRLLMMNGNMMGEITSSNPLFNATGHVGMFARDDQAAVETLYLCALNRYPSAAEQQHFVARISEAENRNEALEDLVWILLNSSELAWNH